MNAAASGNTDKGMNTESPSKDWYLFTDGVELWAGRPLPPVAEWLEQEGLLCLQSPAFQASARETQNPNRDAAAHTKGKE